MDESYGEFQTPLIQCLELFFSLNEFFMLPSIHSIGAQSDRAANALSKYYHIPSTQIRVFNSIVVVRALHTFQY